MQIIHFGLAVILAFSCAATLQAQENPPAAPAAANYCEHSSSFDDWDFWVGEWEVYSNDEASTHLGNNSVTKHHANCLIQERWIDIGGAGGFSINYYNAVKGEWRQIWIGNAYAIDFIGGLNDKDQMVLEGEIYNYPSNTASPFRGNWTQEENGDVIRRFEVFNSETNEWNVWFEGRYVKQ